MPAQLTRPWTAPNAASAAAPAALPLVSSVTSVRTNRAAAPSSSVNALPSTSFRSATMTRPPPSTTMRAVAAPRPDAPPVTMNVLSRISIRILRRRPRADAGPLGSELCVVGRRFHHRQRRRDEAGDVGHIRRQDQRVRRLREVAELRDVLLRHSQIDRLHATWRADRLRDLADRLCRRFRLHEGRRGLALSGVDLRLLLAFRLGDRRLARPLRDV